jgi:regulatory factor X 1/2/3
LADHIRTAFASHPSHLLRAKLIPATCFARLLARLIRVNDTAHAAARFLANPADRDLMRSDWARYVVPSTIVQRELPCGHPLAIQLLGEELLALLSPEEHKSNGVNGARKRLRTDLAGHSLPPTFSEFEAEDPGVETANATQAANATQGVLDQWAMWLCELPARFPRVPPRVFLWCMESVGAAALRDITVAGGEGFGAWWVVRCWIDEWMGWIADKGGFLDMDAQSRGAAEMQRLEDSGLPGEGPGLSHDTLTF